MALAGTGKYATWLPSGRKPDQRRFRFGKPVTNFRPKLHWSGADVNGNARLGRSRSICSTTLSCRTNGCSRSAKVSAGKLGVGPPAASNLSHITTRSTPPAFLNWQQGHFDVDRPDSGRRAGARRQAAPVLEAHAEAHGDRHSITLAALHLTAPFATAELSSPVTYDFAHGFHDSAAQFDARCRPSPARLGSKHAARSTAMWTYPPYWQARNSTSAG